MRLAPPSRRSALMWFGLFGAPLAFTAQHLTGFALTQAACGSLTTRRDVHLDAWAIVVTAVAVTVIAGSGLAAFATWRLTRDEEELPGTRIHFLAVIGMAIAPIFGAIVLMSGLGVVFLPECVQS